MTRHAVRDPNTGRFVRPAETEPDPAPAAAPAADVRADQPTPAPVAADAQGAGPAAPPEPAPSRAPAAPGARPAPMASPLGTLLPRVVTESPVKPDPKRANEPEPTPAPEPGPAPATARPAPGGRFARVAIGGAVGLVLLLAARVASGALRAWSGRRGQPPASAPTVAEPPTFTQQELDELRRMGIDPRTRTL